MRSRLGILICFLLSVLMACEDPPNRLDPDIGLDFFPLEIGDFRVYNVETINIDKDTTNYQLKEVVADSFAIGQGETAFVLHRFTREQENLPWDLDSVWTARLSGRYAVVVENNIPFAKVHFPVAEGLTWDGNSFNSAPEAIYEVKSLDQPFQVEDQSFNRSLEINEKDVFDTLIFRDVQKAVYAREIGLIYIRKERIDFCRFVECLGEIESGTIVEQKLVDYGQE
ncbi:MAG: hypothetical protein ACR2MX_02650 [Cyclobacteriaceae bacterium]